MLTMRVGELLLFISLANASQGNLVKNCPKTSTEWDKREQSMDCREGTCYHCLLLYKSADLYEVCMLKRNIPPNKGGCLWIFFDDKGVANFGARYSSCPTDLDGCPPKEHVGYFSDQLYLYPMCFTAETNRSLSRETVRTSPYAKLHITEETTTTVSSSFFEEPSSVAAVVLGILLIVVVIVVVVVFITISKNGVIMWKKTRRCANDAEEKSFLSDEMLSRKEKEISHADGAEESESLIDEIPPRRPEEISRDELREKHHYPFVETNIYKTLIKTLETKKAAWLCGIYGSGKERSVQMYSENINAVLWKFNCSSRSQFQRELNDRLTGNDLNFSYSEKDKFETIANRLADQLKSVCDDKKMAIVFFCNVAEEVVIIVNTLSKRFVKTPCVKCIASSNNRKIFSGIEGVLNDGNTVSTDKGFSLEEALQFLSPEAEKEKHKDAVAKLCEMFDSLPISLAIAKGLMIESSISPKGLLKELTEHKTGVSKQKMNRMLLPLSYIINRIDSIALELLTFCQFLHNKTIPVCMLKYLPPSKHADTGRINSLFIDVEKFSLGRVKGRDEDRKLDIHNSIRYYIQNSTTIEDKQKKLEETLVALTYLFCKQQSDQGDHARCVTMLSHADEAIKHADNIFKPMSMKQASIVVLVCDRTAHTFEIQGYYQSQKRYIQKALDLIYAHIIKMSLDELGKKDSFISRVTDLYHETLAARIANQIDENLMSNQEAESIASFLREYTFHKHRTRSNIEELTKCLEKQTLQNEKEITYEEHGELVKKGTISKGGSEVKTANNFLIELVAEVSQDYGRMLLSSNFIESNYEKCKDHLLLGYYLAENHLKGHFPGNTPLCEFQSSVNGKLELDLQKVEAKLKTKGNKIDTDDVYILNKTVDHLENRLRVKCHYFVFGMPVSDNQFPDYVIMCRQQLLRCFTLLYKATQNAEDKEKMENEAQQLLKLLLKDELKFSESSQRVKHFLVGHFKGLEKYDDSIKLLEGLPHFRFKPSDYPLTDLDVHDMKMTWELYLLKEGKGKNSSFLQELLQYQDRNFTDSKAKESFMGLMDALSR